jgi:hypothetical protein
MKNKIWIFLILFILLIIPFPSQAQTSQQTLAQYITDLQKNPNDNALREKIIKHVQTMKPKPAIPEEAERFMARGTAAVKNAKTPGDFKDAVAEFEKAVLAAPWLSNAYYSLGIAQDKAGIYADAIKSLNLYILASPNASDVKAVKNIIYEIEYKQEKAAKESSPAAMAEMENAKADSMLKSLYGRRYVTPEADDMVDDPCERSFQWIEIRDKEVAVGSMYTWQSSARRCSGGITTNVTVGKPFLVGNFRVTSKKMQGNELVLETEFNQTKTLTFSADRYRLNVCSSNGSACEEYKRER